VSLAEANLGWLTEISLNFGSRAHLGLRLNRNNISPRNEKRNRITEANDGIDSTRQIEPAARDTRRSDYAVSLQASATSGITRALPTGVPL